MADLPAIVLIPGIPCVTDACPHVWDVGLVTGGRLRAGWIVSNSEVRTAVSSGKEATCPLCQVRQYLPMVFDHLGAWLELSSNGRSHGEGYLCPFNPKGRLVHAQLCSTPKE